MGTIAVTDFKYGLDRRRPRVAGAPGTIWDIQNAHITRGGDIESPRAMVPQFTLPAGTFGLAQAAGQLYAFGSDDLAALMPIGVQYLRCQAETSANMIRVLDAKAYQGKVYTIAEFDDGIIRHYYNGTKIHDWDGIGDVQSSFSTLAAYLAQKISADSTVAVNTSGSVVIVTAKTPGNPFTVSASAIDGGSANDQTAVVATPTANVAAVPEVKAIGTVTITGGTASPGVNKVTQIVINSTNLLALPVDWTGSNNATALAVANAINSNTPFSGYTAIAPSTNVVTITAPSGPGATLNGLTPAVTNGGNVTTSTTNMAGGVTNVTAVAQVSTVTLDGTFEPLDTFTATVNGTPYAETGLASFNATAAAMATAILADTTVTATSSANVVTITAKTPGTAFTISATAVDGGSVNDQTATVNTPVANVPEVAEVASTASVTISGGSSNPGVNQVSQIMIGATNLVVNPVDWILTDEATAAAVVAEINNNAAITGGYTASEAAGVITIAAAPGQGATPNGTAVSVTANGMSAVPTNMAGGITAVSPIAQVSTITLGGTYEPKDLFTIIVNGVSYIGTGRASGSGTLAFVYKQRVYCPAGTFWRYCVLNDATDWNDTRPPGILPASGAGFIDISALTDGSERLTGAAIYAGYVGLFTAKTVLLYFLDPDATTVSEFQKLDNTGTIAGLSGLNYGLDCFYLDTSGVRSLRARDASNTAIINDIGTVIDPFIQDWISSVGNGVAAASIALIEPFDSRFWLVIGSRIFSLSLFQTAGISAWSYYDFGLTFTAFARVYNQLYARAGDTIYLYGGPSGNDYPAAGELPITVSLPFMSANAPTTFKQWTSFDMACFGAWSVTFLVEPTDETQEIFYGTATGTTYGGSLNSIVGRTTMFAIRFDCASGGKVTLSNFSAHFEETEGK
jgi:hypothetical protein